MAQGRVGDVALVLIEFAGREEPARRNERVVQLIDHRRFPDAGIAGDQHQLRRPALDDAVEGGEQGFDLARSPVEFFRKYQPIRHVVRAEREGVDAAAAIPFGKAALEIALEAGGGLIALLGCLGEQLHDEGRDRRRDRPHPLSEGRRPSRNMAVDPLHRIDGGERQGAGDHLVKRDAEGVEVAARIDRAVHPSGLFGRHIGEGAGDELGGLRPLALARQT